MNNHFPKGSMNHSIFQEFLDAINIERMQREFFDKLYDEMIKKIDAHIQEKTPELLTNFTELYRELTRMTEKIEQVAHEAKIKSKKIYDSACMAEDLYKMRDEMKEIKQLMTKFQANMKKMFK